MRIVVVSDTHGKHNELSIPDGDVFVHCGDLTNKGTLTQLSSCAEWIRNLPHKHKIVIAGNHDFCLQDDRYVAESLLHGTTYLRDSGTMIDGVEFWGSPWQPYFGGWAFNIKDNDILWAKWDLIPVGTHVLITHGPPAGILDMTARGVRAGCQELSRKVLEVAPKLHLFGHIHEAAGEEVVGGTRFVNASVLDLGYNLVNQARVYDI